MRNPGSLGGFAVFGEALPVVSPAALAMSCRYPGRDAVPPRAFGG